MAHQGPSFLLPQNRKLRHLRGVSLRNLTFARPRGRTIDDSSIQRSSDTREPLRFPPSLAHAHSSDDIRVDRARGRRVTLSGTSANARQRILEQALEPNTADAFFSLHHHAAVEPIYVSEVEDNATNFNFRLFDLTDVDPHVSRGARLVVKVWVRRAGVWCLLIEDHVDLRCLGCIGPSLQGKSRGPGAATSSTAGTAMHFPPNSIVFHLVDGIYMFGVGADGDASSPLPPPSRKQAPPLSTASYTALMRLANLENSLQDALASQVRLAAQIDDLLRQLGDAEATAATAVPDAEARTRRVLRGAAHQRRGAELARQKRDDIGRSLRARRAAIAAGRALQQTALDDIEHAARKLAVSRETALQTADDIRGQRRRVCEDLMRIFAIEPIPPPPDGQQQLPPPLSFQICGMALPNTDYGPALLSGSSAGGFVAEEVLSAALGFVAVLAHALQTYLGVVLPYRITPYGSRSAIRDDISKIPDQQRDFPLHMPRGGLGAQYRFDYAWFLLNKDIETLCSAQGIRVVDIRHTLPNLKYLLYVCSSGSKELPQRKKGGVRGLRALQKAATDDSIPRNLAVSAEGKQQQQQLPQGWDASSNGKTAASLAQAVSLNLPFSDGGAVLTLRTKGMRENVDGRL